MKKVVFSLLSIVCVFVAFTAITACDKKADNAAPAAAADNAAADNAAPAADKAAASITGKWNHDGYVYDFKDDGTGTYDVGSGDLMKFTYKAENGKLSITYEGSDPMVLDYELKDNVLNVKDSFGKDTLYNRQ